ncbi:Hypothetical predicted protein [Lynx pardinus]|uniref:Uncharacterized protein n=1 Tax=Lynx pardinus TaxID=191816 RepID=A0A485MC79_LYNPA|nr:Hypothetical predicted protein [Lynx pardinus]
MLQLVTSLALLGALATPAGTSKTCPVCSLLGNCTEMTCPPTKEACVFGQMQLENGTLIRNGSCVVSECREGVYTLTYGPHSSLWVSTDCCVNGCGRAARQEAGSEAQLNGVQCPYCSGDKSASCDSLSVMNCTGDQTMCLTLNGTWNGGGPQILKGCATPNVCHLQVNTTLGPEASGFRLVSQPECNYVVTPTVPGPPANTSLTADRVTVCVTCSGLDRCDPVFCPADRNYCLQTAGILGSQNVTLRGCGSQNLCGVSAATAKALLTSPGHRLAHQPHCSTTRRATLESECASGAPPGLRLARSVLLVALGFLALS